MITIKKIYQSLVRLKDDFVCSKCKHRLPFYYRGINIEVCYICDVEIDK